MANVEGDPSNLVEMLRAEAHGRDGLVTASLDIPLGEDGAFTTHAGLVAALIQSSGDPNAKLRFRVVASKNLDEVRPREIQPEKITLAGGRLVVKQAVHRFVYIDDAEVPMPRLPYSILWYLGHPSRADREVRVATIGMAVWGPKFRDMSRKNVQVQIGRLRSALGMDDLGHVEEGVIRNGYGSYRALSVLGRTATGRQP